MGSFRSVFNLFDGLRNVHVQSLTIRADTSCHGSDPTFLLLNRVSYSCAQLYNNKKNQKSNHQSSVCRAHLVGIRTRCKFNERGASDALVDSIFTCTSLHSPKLTTKTSEVLLREHSVLMEMK